MVCSSTTHALQHIPSQLALSTEDNPQNGRCGKQDDHMVGEPSKDGGTTVPGYHRELVVGLMSFRKHT